MRPAPAGGIEMGLDLAESPSYATRYARAWASEPGKMTWNHVLGVVAAYGAKQFFEEYDVTVQKRRDEPEPETAAEPGKPPIVIQFADGSRVEISR